MGRKREVLWGGGGGRGGGGGGGGLDLDRNKHREIRSRGYISETREMDRVAGDCGIFDKIAGGSRRNRES